MGFISIDAWIKLQENKDKTGLAVISSGKNKGKNVPVADLRVRISEEGKYEVFTLDKFVKIVSAKGNEYQVNSRYEFPEKSGNFVPSRIVKLASNGVGDELMVRKGDEKWTTYQLASGLVEAFALVCQQTIVANENFRNRKEDKR